MTDLPQRKVLVVLGATGQQGGAVVRALAGNGQWNIQTLSRNPGSAASQQLARHGVEVIAGDMDKPRSLQAAFQHAHGVFSVQGTDQGLDTETRRGIAVADAALAAGVKHFIYASVGGAQRRSGVPHFDSKWLIEEHIRNIGLPATIVRPTFFMENFVKPSMRIPLMALMRSYLRENKPLQMISVTDIGKWVARAFADPGSFIGKAEEIAGDELTRSQIISIFRRHGWFAGLPGPVPKVLLRALPDDIIKMFEWFSWAGYQADIRALRAEQPNVLTLGEWLVAQKTNRRP